MKLLFDHNLSYRLVSQLDDCYPGSVHVRDVELQTAVDEALWHYARQHDFTIVSKDADFHQRSLVFGAPPKVIWLDLGNCSTAEVATCLRVSHSDVLAFEKNSEASFLVLA